MKRNTLMYAASFGALVITSGLMGCAHSAHTRGSVALKHGAQEADICLGKGEVKVGDKVALFKNECKPRNRGGKEGGESSSCTKVKLGEGRVSQVLDEHYSTIQVDSGVSFAEGTIVEKQ
jgi:hypothetical protein